MSDRPRQVVVGVAAVSFVALASGCTGSASKIATATVSVGDVVETVDAAGAVTPRSQAVLTSPGDAVVNTVEVGEGQRVREGQVLVQLRSDAATARLAAARRAAATAGSPTGTTTVDLRAFASQMDAAAKVAFAGARAAALQVSDRDARDQALEQVAQAERQYAVSKSQADVALLQAEQGLSNTSAAVAALGNAQRQQANAAVAAAQAGVDALTIRAPFAGTATLGGVAASSSSGLDLSSIAQSVGAGPGVDLSGIAAGGGAPQTVADIEPGAHVSSGTPIATVVDATSLSVTANVDETDVLRVRLGDSAVVDLDAVPGGTYPGRVIAVDQLPATTSGGSVTYRVRLSLAAGHDADGHAVPKPRAGMSAVATIKVATSSDLPAVPAAAIVKDGTHDSVWVVTDGRAHRQTVQLGPQGDATVAVSEGIEVGDRVVVKGADRVSEGQKISK